jgi:hypothetical protein
MLLLVMPFLFVIGTVASSAAVMGPISVGSHYIPVDNIASMGKILKSATEGIVFMEIDIAHNIICHIKQAKPIETKQVWDKIRRFSSLNA